MVLVLILAAFPPPHPGSILIIVKEPPIVYLVAKAELVVET